MAQPMPAEPTVAEITPEDFGVLVGWMHHECAQGINLGVQSARSQAAWSRGEIDKRNFLMTRNQALLLARYLLDATGQTLEADGAHRWRALWARITDKR